MCLCTLEVVKMRHSSWTPIQSAPVNQTRARTCPPCSDARMSSGRRGIHTGQKQTERARSTRAQLSLQTSPGCQQMRGRSRPRIRHVQITSCQCPPQAASGGKSCFLRCVATRILSISADVCECRRAAYPRRRADAAPASGKTRREGNRRGSSSEKHIGVLHYI